MQSLKTLLRYVVLSIGSLSLVAAVGCGSGSPTLTTGQGNFSNANLKGSYVYELQGGGLNNLGSISPYCEVGVLVADGQGNIGSGATPGSDDISGSASPVAVTGKYSIAQDGTGTLTMTSQLGTIHLALTMVSNSRVYLMEGDGGATTGLQVNAVGVAELQDSTAIATTPTGAFAFHMHEQVGLASGQPTAQVGGFTAPGNGVNGAMDQNSGGTFSSPNITWTFNAPAALGRGTGTYVDGSTNATSNFIYYIVSSSKVDLLESDSSVVGSGAAEAQTGAVGSGLSGTYAFGSNGDDSLYTQGFYGTVATVGEFNASGGNLTGLEDTNVDTSTTSSVAITGCYTASANGRVAVMSTSGNTCTATLAQVYWMVSASRAFFLDVNSGIFDDGVADLQTVSNFSSSAISGQFALIMGGLDVTPELLTRIGTLQFKSGGKVILNELASASASGAGGQSPGILSGNVSVAANGRITGGAGNNNGGVDFVMYAVSGSKAYALQNDPGFVTYGTMELQP